MILIWEELWNKRLHNHCFWYLSGNIRDVDWEWRCSNVQVPGGRSTTQGIPCHRDGGYFLLSVHFILQSLSLYAASWCALSGAFLFAVSSSLRLSLGVFHPWVAPLLWSTFEVDSNQPILGPFREEYHSRGLGHSKSNFLIGIVYRRARNQFHLFILFNSLLNFILYDAMLFIVSLPLTHNLVVSQYGNLIWLSYRNCMGCALSRTTHLPTWY